MINRKHTKENIEMIVECIRHYFKTNASPSTKAIIGISGGKDSTIAATLCTMALGKDRVYGVMMPCGVQDDIQDSYDVVNYLGIDYCVINIEAPVAAHYDTLKYAYAGMDIGDEEAWHRIITNAPARIRMTTLYSIAALIGGRVINTCNASEDFIGYSTKFGDGAGDYSPLGVYTVTEVIEMGKVLGLPERFIFKAPSDGMCGKTDEENLGFTYKELDKYLLDIEPLSPDTYEKVKNWHNRNIHKLIPMPKAPRITYPTPLRWGVIDGLPLP